MTRNTHNNFENTNNPTTTQQQLPMVSTAPEESPSLYDIGLCRSWKEQQKNISTFLHLRSLRSTTVPRLLLAQFDDDSITVYQAYKPSIGLKAVQQGNFLDSEFSFSRMTWVKPNFSWMMHRSGWASKKDQEIVLAIKLKRTYFEELLEKAISTTWDDASFGSLKEWSQALRESDVVVQWDPDHHLLSGSRLPYRVLQVGIRRSALEGFKGPGIIAITNITDHVHRIRKEVLNKPINDPQSCDVETPLERRYPVSQSIQQQYRLN